MKDYKKKISDEAIEKKVMAVAYKDHDLALSDNCVTIESAQDIAQDIRSILLPILQKQESDLFFCKKNYDKAKQKDAIGFVEFTLKWHLSPHCKENRWRTPEQIQELGGSVPVTEGITTTELYELYLKQK